jgi:hypothetical protein
MIEQVKDSWERRRNKMGGARQPVCQGEERWDRTGAVEEGRKQEKGLDRLGRKAEQ